MRRSITKCGISTSSAQKIATRPRRAGWRIFSRDLWEVEVLSANRSRRLVTLYVTHLKSTFSEARTPAERARDLATATAARQRPGGRFVLLGDMKDAPDSAPLAPFVDSGMTLGLSAPSERGGSPGWGNLPAPTTSAWTHRFVEGGCVSYELLDQIWLSPALAGRPEDAYVLRRRSRGRDGSDHAPVWVELLV